MDRNTNFTLYRTNDPKFTTYQGDGSGRDTYIVLNDGGLQPDPMRKGLNNDARFNLSSKAASPKAFGFLLKPSQRIYYPPNGSGRDTYIIDDNGGTGSKLLQKPYRIDFTNNDFLRDSPFKTPVMNRRLQDRIPSMKAYTNWPSKQAVLLNQMVYQKQRNLTDKLSPHKVNKRCGSLMDGATHDMLRATNITMASNQRSNHGLGSFRRQSVIDQSPERKFFKRRVDTELGPAREEVRTSNNERKKIQSMTTSPSRDFNK